MTRTLNAYLLKSFWATLLLIVGVFLGLVIVADILEHMEDFLQWKVPFYHYLTYYSLFIPSVLSICLPVATMLAGMRLFRELSVSNEYIALIMGGISLWRILKPIIWSAVLLCGASYFIGDYLAPQSSLKRSMMRKEKFKTNISKILNRTIPGHKGQTVYVSEYDKNQRKVKGLMVIEYKENKILRRSFAEEADWKNNQWEGKNVREQNYSKEGNLLKAEFIKVKHFPELFHHSELILRRNESDYLTSEDILSFMNSLPESKKKEKTSLLVDYYRRFSFCWVPLVLLLIAIPCAIAPVRSAASKTMGFGILICLGYYILDTLFIQAAKGMVLDPLYATWMANILFCCMGFFLMSRVEH